MSYSIFVNLWSSKSTFSTSVVLKGLILKSTGSWYSVLAEDKSVIQCRVKGKFRIQGIKTTNPVTVGDRVQFEKEKDGTGAIFTIEERKNYIIRRSINLSKQTHIIAANMDQALLVISLVFPKTLVGFIDRFLVTAEAYSIPVVLVFNKTDLYQREELELLSHLKQVYEKIGYNCLETSVVMGKNLKKFNKILVGKTTLLSGNSGVGKSTLVNTFDSNFNLKTAPISESTKTGKHTTTFAEMHPLSDGGYVIDTPGIKSFGIVDFKKEELYHYFPEFFSASTHCKFHNCVHIHETKCAIKESVESGEIASFRYDNYLKLYYGEDLEDDY